MNEIIKRKEKISAVLIVRNEEKNIKDCLESIKWVDEIIVVDQSSTDKTVEIAKNYTDKIYITEPKGICEPDRNFAIQMASNSWILLIDADLRITDELRKEILLSLSSDKEVFYLPAKNYFIGKWIRGCGWWPGYMPRLFIKGKIKFSPNIHEEGEIFTKKIGYLKNPIIHYSYDSIGSWISKFDRYTSKYAEEYLAKYKTPNFFLSVKELVIRPIYFFILKYFFKKGFLDGWRGFFISVSSAITVFMSYIKFLELTEKNEKNNLYR
ncbi:MAG: glycosyltransferase family 2 protein [Elusimicrobiota bacterium]